MKKLLFIILASLLLLSSCDGLMHMPDGEDNVNYLIYPYLRFELSDDGTYYTAAVLEGARPSYVSIPGEHDAVDGALPVRVFKGFENPADSVYLRTLVLSPNVSHVADGALNNATALESIISRHGGQSATWAYLPDLSKDGCHFLGWYAGGVQICQGMPIDPENDHASPLFEEHRYIAHEGKSPSCTVAGFREYITCSVCGYSTYEAMPPTGHQVIHVDAAMPSCEEEGTRDHWHCSLCGKDFSDENARNELDSITILPLGHSLVHHGRIEPSCQSEGTEAYYLCSRCGNFYGDKDALHKVTPADLQIPGIIHTYDTSYHSSITHHWHECTMCGVESGKEAHSIVQTIIKSPTETMPGRVMQECSICLWSRTISLPIIGAEYTMVQTVPPTCTSAGTVVYEYVNEGAGIHDNHIEITADPLGHQGKNVAYRAPSCTEEGRTAHFHCERCGKNYANSSSTVEMAVVAIPMSEHEYSTIWSVNGSQHWHECLACGAKTDISGHRHDQSIPLSQYQSSKADCTDPFRYFKSCICGHSGTETFTYGDPLGHSLEHVDKVDPPCAEGGHMEYYECSRCHVKFLDNLGTQDVTSIQAEHVFDDGAYRKTSAGHTHICDVCHLPVGEEESHNSNKVSNNASSHWWSCSACLYMMTAGEPHDWVYETDGSRHCLYCGRSEADPQTAGGFDVDIDSPVPDGTLTLLGREGTTWTFRLTDGSAGSEKRRITSVSWVFDGEEIPEFSDKFEASFKADHPRNYVVMCVFISEGGGVGSKDYSFEGGETSL